MSNLNKQHKIKLIMAARERAIRSSRDNFWIYCKTLSPEFYKDTRPHLKKMCDTLEALWRRELVNPNTGKAYKKLALSIPPRHGKSRTLVMFTTWALGKENSEKIITCSYSEDLATTFSKFTRDEIQKQKARPTDITFQDIFNINIKRGDASYKQWSLEGQFFNYKGAGLGSGITGKGASILIADDLVKGSEEALSQSTLDSIWGWYTGTCLSRAEEGCLQIVCMTRWSKEDPIGRLLNGPTADEWYVLEMEVLNEETGEMLCSSIFSKESYDSLSLDMPPMIFRANYHNELIDVADRLYTKLLEYSELPEACNNIPSKAQIDVADTGKDYTCCIIYKPYKGQAYVQDIYYSQAPMEITEVEVSNRLYTHNVREVVVESNNGGRGYARNLERLLYENHKWRGCLVRWFNQSSNKVTKILTTSATVMNSILFPKDWDLNYKAAYNAIISYSANGKNKNDDLPDTISEIALNISNKNKGKIVTKKSLGL